MRCGQFRDALIDRPRIGHVTKSKIVVDGRGRELLWYIGVDQKGTQFGRKNQRARGRLGVIKWFFPKPIAREEEKLSFTIPQSKGEHPREAIKAIDAPTFPAM